MQIFEQEYVILNKRNAITGIPKYHFWRDKYLEMQYSQTQENCMLIEMPTPLRIAVIFNIMNYLGRYSSLTAEVCAPLRKLTSSKMSGHGSTPMKTYTKEPRLSSKRMKPWYSTKRRLNLETVMPEVGLRASLLQVKNRMQLLRNEASDNAALWPVAFINKNLTCAETHCSNIGKEALEITMA